MLGDQGAGVVQQGGGRRDVAGIVKCRRNRGRNAVSLGDGAQHPGFRLIRDDAEQVLVGQRGAVMENGFGDLVLDIAGQMKTQFGRRAGDILEAGRQRLPDADRLIPRQLLERSRTVS